MVSIYGAPGVYHHGEEMVNAASVLELRREDDFSKHLVTVVTSAAERPKQVGLASCMVWHALVMISYHHF